MRLAFAILPLAAAPFAQNPATTVTVDAAANRHPINPNIYGIAYGGSYDMKTLNALLNRWGGNSTTRYNWQIDAHSAAADWYFETYSDGNGTPSGSAEQFLATTRSANNRAPLFTIPMIDFLANLGANRSTLRNSRGVANSTSVQQTWVQHFVSLEHRPARTASGTTFSITSRRWHSAGASANSSEVSATPSALQTLSFNSSAMATLPRSCAATASQSPLRLRTRAPAASRTPMWRRRYSIPPAPPCLPT
jgi:hypothetical protein